MFYAGLMGMETKQGAESGDTTATTRRLEDLSKVHPEPAVQELASSWHYTMELSD
jgi:hypothetical protein